MTRKATVRREQILSAAIACFREKGLKAASINDICTRLSISPGHLYYYFKSKDELIEQIVLAGQRFMLQATDELLGREDALDIVMSLEPEAFFHGKRPPFTLDNATLLELYAEAARGPRLAKLMRAYWTATVARLHPILDSARKKGRIRSQADQELLMMLLATFSAAKPLAEVADPNYDPRAYVTTFKQLISPILDSTLAQNSSGRGARSIARHAQVVHNSAPRRRSKPKNFNAGKKLEREP